MAHITEKLKQELFSLDDEIKTLFSTGKVLMVLLPSR
jgi:hypothetical protein